jgi:hypothetical protein
VACVVDTPFRERAITVGNTFGASFPKGGERLLEARRSTPAQIEKNQQRRVGALGPPRPSAGFRVWNPNADTPHLHITFDAYQDSGSCEWPRMGFGWPLVHSQGCSSPGPDFMHPLESGLRLAA